MAFLKLQLRIYNIVLMQFLLVEVITMANVEQHVLTHALWES